MDKFPLPVDLLDIGQVIPVDVWSPGGQLLLRRGQRLESAAHREALRSHQAVCGAADARAWQQAYERRLWALLRGGASMEDIVRLPMPQEILAQDYDEEVQVRGDWLDLIEALHALLYRAGLATLARERLAGVDARAMALLQADADDSLYALVQALAREEMGYCACHALLCAVIVELAGQRLNMDPAQRHALRLAALSMNIGMAPEQDLLARQDEPPDAAQQALIRDHPRLGADMLAGLGFADADLLDLVRWHHEPDAPGALARNQGARHLLHLADVFVAKMAARGSRLGLPALQAARSVYLEAHGDAVASALAASVGFYPPGSYVRLADGEIGVVLLRGTRANTPWVLPIIDRHGLPQMNHASRDTAEPAYAIREPVDAHTVKVRVNPERAQRERTRIRRQLNAGAAPAP